MALSTKPGRLVSPKFPASDAPSEVAVPAADNNAGAGGIGPVAVEPAAPSWRRAMKDAIRDPAELCRLLDLPAELVPAAERAARAFGLFVPRGFVRRMRRGDVNDPLLRQVLPLGAELDDVAGFTADPVGDGPAELKAGLLQKYDSRALLITTGACAVHCRYCFRRHYPYDTAPKSLAQWEPALEAIAADPAIDEVILSGGDPWTLVDEVLAPLAARIAAIPHVRRLRVHTRLPIFIPERVCDSLVAWFSRSAFAALGSKLAPICVIHANHAAELSDDVTAALARLQQAGVLLLNQAVLLRGVNDSVAALDELSRRLVDVGVVPYYLHQLDRVAGAAHFEVPEAQGLRLIEQLRARLPGYAVPQYVRETAGATSKTPLFD